MAWLIVWLSLNYHLFQNILHLIKDHTSLNDYISTLLFITFLFFNIILLTSLSPHFHRFSQHEDNTWIIQSTSKQQISLTLMRRQVFYQNAVMKLEIAHHSAVSYH